MMFRFIDRQFNRLLYGMPRVPTILEFLKLSELKRHAYITSKSGHGKSYLLKLLFYHLVVDSNDGYTGGFGSMDWCY